MTGFRVTVLATLLASTFIAEQVCADPIGGPNPPEFALWESNMVQYGHNLGSLLDPNGSSTSTEILDAQYYDAQWVLYQVSDYLGQVEPWTTYGTWAELRYRDEHLRGTDYRTQGFRRFPHGLYEDWRRGSDTTITDLIKIRDNPAYSRIVEHNGRTGYYESISREVAYALQANITAEKAGEARVIESGVDRPVKFVEYMENHLWEWRTQTYENPNGGYLLPFMFGLTAAALIEFHEWELANGRDPADSWNKTHWPDIVTALEDVATFLRRDAKVVSGTNTGRPMYVTNYNGSGYAVFRYEDINTSDPAPDLGQLIAPIYYWLYKETGKPLYLNTGDELWGAAVKYGYHDGGKQYNQLYRMAFQGLQWRQGGSVVRPNPPTQLTVN